MSFILGDTSNFVLGDTSNFVLGDTSNFILEDTSLEDYLPMDNQKYKKSKKTNKKIVLIVDSFIILKIPMN